MSEMMGNTAKTEGKLKIFFGYSGGVGKTHAMLTELCEEKNRGRDVVIGDIGKEVSGKDAQILSGFEILPKKYCSGESEFDLDGAIRRKPEILLLNTLSHTNAKFCRHVKRYQDIEELLKAGIDVYTGTDVGHIESLQDIVSPITGKISEERIPDHVFDNAHSVVFIDIEPVSLVKRQKEENLHCLRKHYSILSEEKLYALREIALRRMNDRIHRIREREKKGRIHSAGEHILICLSPSPSNARVIRAAARMARAFLADFTALYVKTDSLSRLSEKERSMLKSNLRLAEQLGATVATVFGEDIALQIAEYSRVSGVSRIVIGRTATQRRFPRSAPLVDKLTSLAPNIDIYIIPDRKSVSRTHFSLKNRDLPASSPITDTFKTLAFLLLSTLLGYAFFHVGFTEANIITVYILGVLLTALTTHRNIYSMFASLFSVILFNFLFAAPRFSLTVYEKGYPVTFLIMFIAGLLVSSLTIKTKNQAIKSAGIAYRTRILFQANQNLQNAEGRESILEETARQLINLFDKTVLYYEVQDGALLAPRVRFPQGDSEKDASPYTDSREKTVAQWVYRNNKHAGATTNTFSEAKCLYLAVRGKQGVHAVFGIALRDKEPDSFETGLVIALLGECALALEKDILQERKKEADLKAEKEKLRANLLRSISHDLRTPLTGISGNAMVLIRGEENLSAPARKKLYTDIYDDSMWLVNLVENLLSVTRIEDGSMIVHFEAELVSEVIEEALRHVDREKSEHTIHVAIEDDLLMAKMDHRLIVQVIINIVNNAIKYTKEGSTITIKSYRIEDMAYIQISDDGEGLSDEQKENIFTMFYTAANPSSDSRRGLGLGLALCKSIIQAHGGTIEVQDMQPHGTVFTFTLHVEEFKL